MKKETIIIALISSLIASGCVNIVQSVHDVPVEYREDFLWLDSIEIGMTRTETYEILGDPELKGKPFKVRWLVYEDDPKGGIEIIYIDERAAKITFARFAEPSFAFSKR